MLTTRRRAAVASLLAVLTLSMTGCSSDSDDGSGEDKIAGADTGKASTSTPSPSAPAEKNAPSFDFPPDIKVSVDRKSSGDPTKDAILRDTAYAAQARVEAFAKSDSRTANMNRYFAANALSFWGSRVETFKKDGLTVTGDYRYFDFEVTDVADGKAAVRYCEDQSKAYNKKIKTNKVQRTQPSDKSFVLYTAQTARDSAGDWQVTQQSWEKGDPACVQR
ncbi:hypothetical protein PV963_26790 [Streptomyces coeruleorubidus]|uniref:hypothetical protein n=1 Tax=Streptomyces coeruleorubidus TaxID=116188 RepID=UPI00237F3D5F|nr:hypothetical protein [Streptomyces coeruleorubidus]WDV53707.1 hypothetical protein PV963_26790 [Streptomyces coeruleorubidus]